jgi:chromosome partitioning protein
MAYMRILTIASQKGGTGKTTLAAHLSVEAERSKAGPVAVIDTDPQGSLAAWWNTREAPTPLFAAVTIAQLTDHLQHLRQQNIRLVIIDTPPQTLDTIQAANIAADFVLIPARPSPHDLRAVAAVVEMVEAAKKPFCFVINGATPRSIIAQQAVGALAEHGKVAPVTIHHRVDFAASMTDGRTVAELAAASPSAKEITTLWKYVLTHLRKYAKED